MPKIVQHDERRIEIVNATWRIIARGGVERATMREIAAEAGFANGALKPYFPTKDDLLAFAFQHVFCRTNERIAIATEGRRGLTALVALCREVLPLDEDRVNEARIVVPYWQNAMTHPDRARFHEEALGQWRAAIGQYLLEARDDGDIAAGLTDEAITEHLITLMIGAQILAALNGSDIPDARLRRRFEEQLDTYLELLRPSR